MEQNLFRKMEGTADLSKYRLHKYVGPAGDDFVKLQEALSVQGM